MRKLTPEEKIERKEVAKVRARLWYKNNKEQGKATRDKWTKNNPEATKAYKDKWKNNNKPRIRLTKNKWRINNPDKVNQYKRKNKAKRLKIDPLFRLKEGMKSMIGNSFRKKGFKKNTKSKDILGCSNEFFKLYIETLWEPWMNWDNKGLYNGKTNFGWDIDHIIPLSTAKTYEDIIRLNHYTNLQPLCSYHNRVIKKKQYANYNN